MSKKRWKITSRLNGQLEIDGCAHPLSYGTSALWEGESLSKQIINFEGKGIISVALLADAPPVVAESIAAPPQVMSDSKKKP